MDNEKIVYVQSPERKSSLLPNLLTLGALGAAGALAIDYFPDQEVDGNTEKETETKPKTTLPDTITETTVATTLPRDLTTIEIMTLGMDQQNLENTDASDGNNVADSIDAVLQETFGGTFTPGKTIEDFMENVQIQTTRDHDGSYTISILSSDSDNDGIYAPFDDSPEDEFDPNHLTELLRWHASDLEMRGLQTLTNIDFEGYIVGMGTEGIEGAPETSAEPDPYLAYENSIEDENSNEIPDYIDVLLAKEYDLPFDQFMGVAATGDYDGDGCKDGGEMLINTISMDDGTLQTYVYSPDQNSVGTQGVQAFLDPEEQWNQDMDSLIIYDVRPMPGE